jgi:hypothetical protein
MRYFVTVMIIMLIIVFGWRVTPREERELITGFIKPHIVVLLLVAFGLFGLLVAMSLFEIKIF